jgi:hypothetical protein
VSGFCLAFISIRFLGFVMAKNPNASSAAKDKQGVCSKIKRRAASIRAFLDKQVTNLYS